MLLLTVTITTITLSLWLRHEVSQCCPCGGYVSVGKFRTFKLSITVRAPRRQTSRASSRVVFYDRCKMCVVAVHTQHPSIALFASVFNIAHRHSRGRIMLDIIGIHLHAPVTTQPHMHQSNASRAIAGSRQYT